MDVTSLTCPRCGRKLTPMVNGGALWLRCDDEPPKCGVMWPAATAVAEHIANRPPRVLPLRREPPQERSSEEEPAF